MHKLLSYDEQIDSCYVYGEYNTGSDNRNNRDKMKSLLAKAIAANLTERQRDCIVKHYYEGKKLAIIATELGIDKSTVSRHISSGERKLKRLSALL